LAATKVEVQCGVLDGYTEFSRGPLLSVKGASPATFQFILCELEVMNPVQHWTGM
jgi:hypothetical protein